MVQNSNLVGAKFKISKTSQPKFASELGFWTFSSLVEHFRNVFETVQAIFQLTKLENPEWLQGNTTGRIFLVREFYPESNPD